MSQRQVTHSSAWNNSFQKKIQVVERINDHVIVIVMDSSEIKAVKTSPALQYSFCTPLSWCYMTFLSLLYIFLLQLCAKQKTEPSSLLHICCFPYQQFSLELTSFVNSLFTESPDNITDQLLHPSVYHVVLPFFRSDLWPFFHLEKHLQ